MKITEGADISRLYEGQSMPELATTDIEDIIRFFDTEGYSMQEGAVTTDPTPSTAEVFHLTKRFKSLGERAFIMGPYVLDGKYYPNGIGGWGRE